MVKAQSGPKERNKTKEKQDKLNKRHRKIGKEHKKHAMKSYVTINYVQKKRKNQINIQYKFYMQNLPVLEMQH